MNARSNPDWIKCHSGDEHHGMAMALECQHCGTIQKIVLPMEASLYIALSKAFITSHRECKGQQ